MLKAKQKKVSLLVACLTMLCAVFFAFVGIFNAPSTTASAATVTVTDILTRDTTGVAINSNTYTNWTATSNSAAVYAGQSAGGKDSIQIRTTNSNSGIVTTTSGGIAKKITVVWHTATSNGRTLNIYGKNSAYSKATDLYNASTDGDQLGTIVKGTSTAFTISGSYTHIGVRSSSGAMYLTSISIEWAVDDGACDECDYSNGYTYTSNNNKTHDKAGTCTVCETEKTVADNEACTFDSVVTPPTTTENGYTTYTCKYCGYSYTDDEVPALNATKYTLSFSVPHGVSSIPSEEVGENMEFELPTANNCGDYTFVGWMTEKYDLSETKPSQIHTTTFVVEKDTTLYALYALIEDTKLVKNVNDLAVGKEIIIAASGYDYALSTTQNTNNRGCAAIKKGSDILTEFGSDVQIITLEAGTKANTYAFKVGSQYLYAASSSSNHLKSGSKNDNASWAITITSAGIATIKAQGSYSNNWLRYNSSSSLFSCYGSTSKQLDVSIYLKGSTSYTTILPAITSASLTVGEDLKLNYYATLPSIYDKAVMYFTMDNKTVDVEGVKQPDGRYSFSLEVPPQAMSENVSAVLMFDEIELDRLENYSIQQYAENKLGANDSSDKLKQFLTDMLNYGAAAQAYRGVDSTPATDVDNFGAPSTATPTEADNVFSLVDADVDSFPVYFKGANLQFGDVNNIRVTLNAYDANVSLVVNGVEVDLTGTTYMTDDILATGFDDVYTFELYYDGVLMQTLTYSVNYYAYKMQNHETIGALVLALYNYGKSAEAYNN